MKVALLGPNGQLGTDIQCACETRGTDDQLIPISRYRLDVTDKEALRSVLGEVEFDVLINCASYHKTDEAEANATIAFAVNTHAVQEMARICARKDAHLIHISTDYVFGGDVERTEPLVETDPTAPVNVYGASKAMGEVLAWLACERLTILRVASLFGVAGASGKGGNFVETMIRLGRERGKLKVVNDQKMSPTSTADIAWMIHRLIHGGAEPGIYHAVNSGTATWYEFACEIIQETRIDAEVAPCSSAEYPTVAMHPRFSALDNAKLAARFGDIADWRDALSRYLKAKGHV